MKPTNRLSEYFGQSFHRRAEETPIPVSILLQTRITRQEIEFTLALGAEFGNEAIDAAFSDFQSKGCCPNCDGPRCECCGGCVDGCDLVDPFDAAEKHDGEQC